MAPMHDAARGQGGRYISRVASTAKTVKNRVLIVLCILLALSAALVLALEFRWRGAHDLAKEPSPSPDGAFVAEVRSLSGQQPPATEVYLRGRWAWLRSLQPHLVFTGECDQVDARWFGARRLVIECELRAGQPSVLQNRFEDVVIEVVVVRRFARGRTPTVPAPAACAT
jgi:hypothetical protein